MTILITGGCGFIGSNLIRALNESGYTDIVVVDNLSRGKKDNIENCKILKFYQVDILDVDALSECFSDVDIVIHLAAYGSVIESIKDPLSNFNINTLGTLNVLIQARLSNVSKVIFSSTGGALIGDSLPPVNELSIPKPISPYGASKLSCEGYCCAFSHSYDIDITVLRFANVVGPFGVHKQGAVNNFINAIISGRPMQIYGNGTSSRDYMHVFDLCDGIIKAFESSKTGYKVYHLASGVETTIKSLSEIIKTVTGKTNHKVVNLGRVKGEVDRNFASYELAQKELGFFPKRNLLDAISDTYSFFVKRNHIEK